jgi:hypothetical protein
VFFGRRSLKDGWNLPSVLKVANMQSIQLGFFLLMCLAPVVGPILLLLGWWN